MASQSNIRCFLQPSSGVRLSSSDYCEASTSATNSYIDSDSEDSDHHNQSESPPLHCPAKRRKKEKRIFREEWKVKYMMWPVKGPGKQVGADPEESEMICIHCQELMKAKSSTAKRHLQRKHPFSISFSTEKKERLVRQFERMYSKQKSTMVAALEPEIMVKLAPYKLAFVLGKHKLSFSSCESFLEFARAADPSSIIFKRMAGSRDTVTKRSQEIQRSVLMPNIVRAVNESPCWSMMVDESIDSSTMEQLGVYVRYIDLEKCKLREDFLEMKRVSGHPNAENLFNCLMEVIDPDDPDSKLPLNRLAGFTSDGASVMISSKNGVLGKLRRAVNPKLFSTHCPPHRLVLASKEGQKELPDDVEKTISDTLFFFKDSSVRRDEFKKLKDLVEPDSPHVAIVQYHKVRWLSLADCVSRIVLLLPLLVRYFEEQAQDTSNRLAVRNKCRDLHIRLSMPKFHLYLFFLHPHLDLLSSVNKFLQTSNLTLHTVYCKIQALLKTFIAPVVIDSSQSITEDANLRPLEDAIQQFPGSDFQKHIVDCSEHALMSERELNDAKRRMYNYIITIGKALENRFPDMDFIMTNTAFVDPTLRNLQQPDMQLLSSKFHDDSSPFHFDSNVLTSQLRMYQNDTTLDFQYQLLEKDLVKFWCELQMGEDYKELSSLALLLLVISPTSVLCERGFSVMNYVKNEFRSVLTQQNLNASMAIAMTEYTVDTFPFTQLLKK